MGTDITTTGAAGAAPMPAIVVHPSLREGVAAMAPTAARLEGTGLPAAVLVEARAGSAFDGIGAGCTPAVRPWEPVLAGTAVLEHTTRVFGDIFGGVAGNGGYTQRTDSSTPGAQPPRGPLS